MATASAKSWPARKSSARSGTALVGAASSFAGMVLLYNGARGHSETLQEPFSLAARNQLTGSSNGSSTVFWKCDSAGNVIYDGNNFYNYDEDGRLCAVQPVSGGSSYGYLYDADGNRVAKGTVTPSSSPLTTPISCDPGVNGFTLTETYILGLGGEQMTVLDATGKPVRNHVYAGSQLIGTYDSVGLHFQVIDPLGTRRVQTNSIAWPEEQFTNLPFGDGMTASPAPNPTPPRIPRRFISPAKNAIPNPATTTSQRVTIARPQADGCLLIPQAADLPFLRL